MDYLIKGIIWGQAILSLAVMAWLISLLGVANRRMKVLIDSTTEVREKTGYTQSPLLDPQGFIAYLNHYGFVNPTLKEEEPPFTVYADEDLNLLLNISADMLQGRANMDTGIWWGQTLDKILDRLNPQNAPHDCGDPCKVCPSCESKNIMMAWTDEKMQYGHPNPIDIPIHVPVHTCQDCKEAFTDYVAEEIRERAIQQHLASKA